MQDMGHIPEKQMEVCEVCGAFLIVGDAQQRIEDHLMGKQHLVIPNCVKLSRRYTSNVKDRETDERRRRDDHSSSHRSFEVERKRVRKCAEQSRSFSLFGSFAQRAEHTFHCSCSAH
ncbi:Luc7-like protein 3 [Eumeta japonica]|uniref:Luc7-like protein 3 n=1 Tax=Eumeta variegata TaxID=151549 RepID=A0A4C1SC70_EUMVA|nr:Luc7-like protein 3 [Eumeta japonica]